MSKAVLNPYLTFGGNTRQAMEFYQQVFGGTLDIQTFGDFGAPVSDGYKEKVMHAVVSADGVTIMASDAQEGSAPVVGDNVSLSLSGDAEDHDRLTKVFTELADGGSTSMPLGEAPWGATFGTCTDRFGMHWLVNIEKAAG
jgi:PhnB protein